MSNLYLYNTCTTLFEITLLRPALQYIALHDITFTFTFALHHITNITLHDVTLHDSTDSTGHDIALYYITYITFTYTYIHTYTDTHTHTHSHTYTHTQTDTQRRTDTYTHMTNLI